MACSTNVVICAGKLGLICFVSESRTVLRRIAVAARFSPNFNGRAIACTTVSLAATLLHGAALDPNA